MLDQYPARLSCIKFNKQLLFPRLKHYDPTSQRLHFLLAEATPAFWDKAWEGHGQALATKSTMAVRLVRRFVSPAAGPILEAGCGPGYQLAALNHYGYSTVGVDLAVQTVTALHWQRPVWSLALADVCQLPFPAGTFPAALLLGVIEHFPAGYEQSLGEIRRVIRPGGYLFLTVPFLSPLRQWKAKRGFYPMISDPTSHFYQYALPLPPLLSHLQQLGFQVKKKVAYNPVQGLWEEAKWLQFLRHWQQRRWLNRLLQACLSPLAPWLGHTIFIVAQKISGDEGQT